MAKKITNGRIFQRKTKICTVCGKDKKVIHFTQYSGGRLSARCKACAAEYQRKYTKLTIARANPDYFMKCNACGEFFNASAGRPRSDEIINLVKKCKYCGSKRIRKAKIEELKK